MRVKVGEVNRETMDIRKEETAYFVTGGTGFVGTEVIAVLLKTSDKPVYTLVRATDEKMAIHRLKTVWYDMPELCNEIGGRIKPLAGDFLQKDLGLPGDRIQSLKGKISKIFHVGAETGIQKSKAELMAVNRDGTSNVISFAHSVDTDGSLERILFVSTAYTAGRRSGRIMENDPLPDDYSTYYEESKALAESLIKQSGLPYTIARPGMIVGNSLTGRIRNFNTIYYVLKLILQGKLRFIPVSAGQKLNIVPVDYVAEAIVRLAEHPEAKNGCFHLTPPEESKPSAGELAGLVRLWAEKNLNFKMHRIIFLPLPVLQKAGFKHNHRTGEKKKNRLSNLTALMPYFHDEHIFDRSGTDRILGAYRPDWRMYLEPMLEFACRRNFLHQSDRSVFEQVLFRLKSRSAPISYFDIGENGVAETTADEMIQKVNEICLGLKHLGIKKGDRVALTGINCTDYFGLDIAIGLCGGVTVPIYYTTPVEEIEILLEKSGAKWFFVGDRRIMEQISALRMDIPLIKFSEALKVPDENRKYMTWDIFLQDGRNENGQSTTVMTDPEDLVTIRYTSGTTGEPKGVMFNAGQLEWMGQVLTTLLSWKEKQEEMRYLSFLPLSHVVEGILASYAPYYMHCPVKYYYLNDFKQLTEALPKVRPTVFFSVPRFYEKLWQQIRENPVGKKYLKLPEGTEKRVLGRILKRVVLKKAGLDRCSQLIVGSAPISEELLNNLRGLGIEVHNAYGQTEAPLITINRMGDNLIPSIGTPLPDTTVTLSEDGELIVKGPQVCLGYYGLETDTIQNGVLKSGDLGSIDEKGHIYLIGRKKEMIVTSYGKNINISKIEERLKNISGISEAVLIGEKRPYCTALIWTEGNGGMSGLEGQIEEMNKKLSHPETIRKWVIIDRPLSIKNGELTPNLKVRRSVVQEHFKDIIEEMYVS